MATIHYIRQRDPLGLGHAVSVAEAHVGERAVRGALGDDLIHPSVPLLAEMLRVYETLRPQRDRRAGGPAARRSRRYGCIQPERVDDNLARVLLDRGEARARRRAVATSRRSAATCSRPRSSTRCARPSRARATRSSSPTRSTCWRRSRPSTPTRFDHGRFDVGNKLDYLKATVEFAIERDDVGAGVPAPGSPSSSNATKLL